MVYKIKSHSFDLEKLTKTDFLQSNYLLFALLLLPLNWSLEAFKWQKLVKNIEKITFSSSLIAILTGLSLSFFTPFNIGTYLGRVWQMQSEKRYEVFGSLLLSSFLQSFFTFGFGAIALLFFFPAQHQYLKPLTSLILVGILVIITAFIFFKKPFYFLRKYPKYYRFIAIIENYSKSDIFYLVGISGLRYFVFCTQFVLILLAWEVELTTINLFSAVSMSFALKSTLPTLNFLSDLGIRESAAIYTFGFYTSEIELILSASLSLWIINIVLPSLLGLVFLRRAKIRNNV